MADDTPNTAPDPSRLIGLPTSAVVDNGNHFARWVVEAIVSDAVPRCGVVAIYRYFTQHLSVIAKVPASLYQSRINENITSLCLVKFKRGCIAGISQDSPCSG